VGVFHEVTGLTVGGGLRGDFPVTEGLHHRTNVADGSAKVTNSEARLGFCGGEALTAGKVVDDTTLLGKSVA